MGCIVITTIQRPTGALNAFARKASEQGHRLVVVGDRKTPDCDWPAAVEYLGLQRQLELPFRLAGLLPENHYARKNVGYLHAISAGAAFVYDTDDDNAPLSGWAPRQQIVSARRCEAAGWVNAYRWFTPVYIWPRGLPLQFVRSASQPHLHEPADVSAPIQQGLANGSPDVDAVWRLLLDEVVEFSSAPSVSLSPGCWCPFNSQSTWWFPPAYPLLYLPSHVSFRMTDIWRSFIAQRCLWAMGGELVFHGPEVYQDRNEHNLLRDFEQEVPGYLANQSIRAALDALELAPGEGAVPANLRLCYQALARAGLVDAAELPLVDAWLADLRTPDGGAKR